MTEAAKAKCVHLWSKWWPQDRIHKYRTCAKCNEMEVIEVKV